MLRKSTAAFAALASLCLSPAFADPAEYVFEPTVTEGEREFDFKFGTASDPGADRLSAASAAFGVGVTRYWFTEVYAKYEREGAVTRFDAVEWENRFQPIEPGQWPVDLGLVIEIEKPRLAAEGWELNFGPLLELDYGRTQVNTNLLLHRNFRAEQPQSMQLAYQLQMKYRYRESFEFGLQAFGDLGPWNNWAPTSEQSHRAGPAIFGKLPLSPGHALRYNAALLWRTGGTADNRTLRAQIEYEF